MAFYALGVLDKVKKYSMGEVTKKFKGFVQTSPDKEEITTEPSITIPAKKQKQRLTEDQLMQIQLKQYKKLVKLQQEIMEDHENKERQKLEQKTRQLEQLNNEMMQKDIEERKSREKESIFNAIKSGKSKHENTQRLSIS